MPASSSLTFTFEIYNGDQLLRQEEHNAESVTIGSGTDAMLRIEDPALQGLHVVLNVLEGMVQIVDIVGDGTARVNGEALSNTALRSGDVLAIGDIRVVIRMTDEGAFSDDEATRVTGAPAAVAAAAAEPVADEAGPTPEAAFTEEDENLGQEDVMSFVMRAGSVNNEASADRSRGRVLEVAQVFGESVLGVGHFRKGQRVRVGPHMVPGLHLDAEKTVDSFYVPADMLPADNFPLFETTGKGWVCNIAETWAGFVDQGESRRTFAEIIAAGEASKGGPGAYQIAVPEEGRLVVDLGHTLFVAHEAWPGKPVAAGSGESIDYAFIAIMAFIAFMAISFFIALSVLPPPPAASRNELDERLVELLLEKKEEIKEPEKKDPDAGEGAKAKKEEGKTGKKEAKLDKAKGEKVLEKKQMDKEIAENAGLLGALRDDASLDSTLGNAGLSADLNAGIGGLIGTRGTQVGSGGLGGRGGGLGGGGTADGLGGMGTRGRGSGSSGYGSGGGSFGAKSEGGIGAVGGDPIILGALDKSLIDAVIKRNMAQIKYCYQRELTKSPSLGGKITVKFVIAKDGSVSSATTKSSTMSNATVESCINSRFMRFVFPEPKGGGIVIVSYPFIFSPG